MEKLNQIAQLANERLSSKVFSVVSNSIMNQDNRYEGNDINMVEENGEFILTMTGITERYQSIDAAVDALVEMYSNE